MFSTPHPNVIKSNTFSVEVLGRTGLRYTDHPTSRTVRIDSELLAGPAGIVVYADSINELGNTTGTNHGHRTHHDR